MSDLDLGIVETNLTIKTDVGVGFLVLEIETEEHIFEVLLGQTAALELILAVTSGIDHLQRAECDRCGGSL